MKMEEDIDNKKVVISLITLLIIFTIASVIIIVFLKQPEKNITEEVNDNSFVFAASGDFDVTDQFKQGLQQIKANNADFTLALGDFSYSKSTEKQWCNDIHAILGLTHPFQLLAGNHDMINGVSMARFSECLPNRIPNMIGDYGRQYYFDYKNIARIIAITPDLEIDGEEYTYKPETEEYKWVMDLIDEAKKDNKWTILAMHKNCLTAGEKTCEIGEEFFKSLVEKKVDLILQGHEHSYFRSDQLDMTDSTCSENMLSEYKEVCVNKPTNNTYQKGEGTILVINGIGGTKLRNHNTENLLIPYFPEIHSKNQDPVHGPSIFTVSENEIKAQLIDTVGQVQDEFYLR